MNVNVYLFIDSNCDLCKTMQHELHDNPPIKDLYIVHAGRNKFDNAGCIAYNITKFPTTLIIDDDLYDISRNDYPEVIAKFEGYVDSETINNKIKEYETKYMV